MAVAPSCFFTTFTNVVVHAPIGIMSSPFDKFTNARMDEDSAGRVVDAWRMSVNTQRRWRMRDPLSSVSTTSNVNTANKVPPFASKGAKFTVPISSTIPTTPSPNAHLCVPPAPVNYPLPSTKAIRQATTARTSTRCAALSNPDSSNLPSGLGVSAPVRAKRTADTAPADSSRLSEKSNAPGASLSTPNFYVISFALGSAPPPVDANEQLDAPPVEVQFDAAPPVAADTPLDAAPEDANAHHDAAQTDSASRGAVTVPHAECNEEPRAFHTVHAILKDIERSKVIVDRALQVLKATGQPSRDVASAPMLGVPLTGAPVAGVPPTGSPASLVADKMSAQAYEEARIGITLLSDVASALERLPSKPALPMKRKAQEICDSPDPQWSGAQARKRRDPLVARQQGQTVSRENVSNTRGN
ncbi:hypothetical protein SCHPADRAFT_946601 [Schizopora paradoxa]|uniref:Uncharacterized protein n=1 Tax=Schizopora paradoxa TaxID=27342 RepID=A0A0H2R234_9AGAM|nr:hypothetical protein SCHPADRAFT_946601 [Schizopora paradoxa]